MPTLIAHTVVAVAAGISFAPQKVPKYFWSLAIIFSFLPDGDVIGFSLGFPYDHFLGHRGFFHSPFFGILLSFFLMNIFVQDVPRFSKQWFFYFLFFFLLTASHGFLDALTNGGLGIALLSPFDSTRYFLPWAPIEVSPIGIGSFISRRGLQVLESELIWIWLPSFLIVLGSMLIRKRIMSLRTS